MNRKSEFKCMPLRSRFSRPCRSSRCRVIPNTGMIAGLRTVTIMHRADMAVTTTTTAITATITVIIGTTGIIVDMDTMAAMFSIAAAIIGDMR